MSIRRKRKQQDSRFFQHSQTVEWQTLMFAIKKQFKPISPHPHLSSLKKNDWTVIQSERLG